MTIAVTGGNGEFGRAVLQSLTSPAVFSRAGSGGAPEPVIATVRDLAKVQALPGVEYRPGDFDDSDTLRASLAGVDTVLVNATFFGTDPSRRLPRVAAAIRAAADASVGRIVLTSWPDLDHARLPGIQDYKQLEELVRSAGPAWTLLRLASGLADAVARDVLWGTAGGELVAPAAGAQSTPAAVADLAAAAGVVLSQPGHECVIHELTGPDAITWDDLATLAGVRFRPVNDDEYRDYLTRFSLSATTTEQLLGLYAEFRSGWAGEPTPALAQLVGRPLVPGIEAVRRRAARFGAAS